MSLPIRWYYPFILMLYLARNPFPSQADAVTFIQLSTGVVLYIEWCQALDCLVSQGAAMRSRLFFYTVATVSVRTVHSCWNAVHYKSPFFCICTSVLYCTIVFQHLDRNKYFTSISMWTYWKRDIQYVALSSYLLDTSLPWVLVTTFVNLLIFWRAKLLLIAAFDK